MTKEYLESILTEYGVAFTDSLADRLLKEFKPCEDCISRTEVIKSIDEREDVNGKVDAESVRTDIVLIPPANPQPKTGHWIALEEWKKDFKGFINELSMPKDDYNGIMEYIDEVPNESKWIPVSERLPEKEGLYLVSVKNDHERRYSKTCQYMGRNHWFARQDVEAWMPLPKPYEPHERSE